MSILIILYMCGVFPLLLGVMGKHLDKKVKMPAYVIGHAIQFAVLFFCGIVIKFIGVSVFSFARGYFMATIAVGIFCVIMTCRKWKKMLVWKKPSVLSFSAFVGELGMLGGSILFLMPHWLDMTEETLYNLQNTGVLNDMSCLLYGIVQQLSEMNPVTMVRVWLTVCFMPLFYATYHYFAKGRIWFLVFTYAIFGFFIFVPGYIGLEVFLNVWNPVTLVVSVLMPLFYVCLIEKSYIELIIVGAAMQGLVSQAWLYMGILICVALIVNIGYQIHDKKEDKKA